MLRDLRNPLNFPTRLIFNKHSRKHLYVIVTLDCSFFSFYIFPFKIPTWLFYPNRSIFFCRITFSMLCLSSSSQITLFSTDRFILLLIFSSFKNFNVINSILSFKMLNKLRSLYLASNCSMF
jgi:hypothetical protein